jgi:predicted PurR-regulated permease PerM
LIVFGPSGLILGPTALTVTIVLLEIWKSRTRETDQARLPH